MAKHKKAPSNPLDPAGSRVRPGFRRSLLWLIHTGKLPALLVLGLSGWGLYSALTSTRYEVQHVDAVGVQALTVDDVRTLAAVDAQPIWYIDPDEVSERVRQSPYVQNVHTRLVLPDKIEISVAERKPEVRWMHDGTVFAVTWDGIVVDRAHDPAAAPPSADAAPVEGAPPADGAPAESAAAAATEAPPSSFVSAVTIVDTTPNRELKIGDHVDPDALELARRISLRAPAEIPTPLTRIEWDAGLGVSVIIGDNRQAVFGRSDNLDQKIAVLRYLLQTNTPFTFLDLRPSTPYYR